jgi:predicted nucleic acid-binding protein
VILVDTTVWIDHFRGGGPLLSRLLERGGVLGHPWVTGELALGNLRRRDKTLRLMGQLTQATVATPAELMEFIEQVELFGLGIGYMDAQLLAATRLTADAQVWTLDWRLRAAAERLGVAYPADSKN